MKKTDLAKAIVAYCFRNTILEDIHADGRISQEEMKELMRTAVSRVYAVLTHEADPEFQKEVLEHALTYTRKWDEPEG
jgi:mRNA degradation ribonuclease J1/J2